MVPGYDTRATARCRKVFAGVRITTYSDSTSATFCDSNTATFGCDNNYDDGWGEAVHKWVEKAEEVVKLQNQAKKLLRDFLSQFRFQFNAVRLPKIYPKIPKWDFRYCSNVSGRRDPKLLFGGG